MENNKKDKKLKNVFVYSSSKWATRSHKKKKWRLLQYYTGAINSRYI